MKTHDFWYDLPEELIAQTPLQRRDSSRLLCLDRTTGEIKHQHFYDIISYLRMTLDRSYEISGNLWKLYEFFGYELARVKSGRNGEELKRVKGMVCELRDAFRTAAANNSSGK